MNIKKPKTETETKIKDACFIKLAAIAIILFAIMLIVMRQPSIN